MTVQRAAAWSIEQGLGATRDRTDAAGQAEDAVAAGRAAFHPYALLGRHAHELRVQARHHPGIREVFSDGLHPDTAAERKHHIHFSDLLGRLVQVFPLALPLDSRVGDILGIPGEFGGHAQFRGDDGRFARATREADRHARPATENEHILRATDEGFDFFECFLFCNDHSYLQV